MAKKLEMSVLLAAVDKITGPLKKMRQASGITATQLKETQDRVKSLNKQSAQIDGYRKISRSLGITSNDLAKAQKEVKRLALEMQSSQAPAKALVKEYEQARAATVRLNTQHKNLTISQHRQRESLRSAGVDTRNLSQHQRTLAAELSQANKQLDQQKRRLQQVSDQQKKLSAAQGRYQKTKALQGNMAGAGATAAASGAAALYAGARVLQPGLDFSAGQSKVQALTRLDKNDPQLIALRKQARELGASTSFTANDVSQGQSFLAMAGFDAKSIKQAMPSMLDLAKANDTDLATTSDIASNILSGFGLAADQMGRLGDVLTATTTRANVNLTMLGDTMKYVAPAARDLGVSVEEAAAMSGLLGNIGIQASQGGTVMRAMLNRLASQSGPAAAAVEYLGLKTKDTAGNLRAVPDILADVVKATKTMGNADRADVLKTIFGEEAGAGVSELIKQQGDGAITSFANVLRNSAGENARVAKTMADNAKGDIDTLKSAWEDVGIEIFEGNDSGIRSFIQQITGVVNGIGNWMRVNPELTGTLFKAAAAMAIVATVGGTLTLMMAGILGPIALLQYSTSVLGINLMGAIAPAGLLTKAFGGLSKGVTGVIGKATNFKGAWAGIGALWKQSDPVKLLPSFASITGGVNRLKASFGALIGRVSAMPHTVMALVKAQWLAVASGTKMAAANAWMATTSAASGIWSSVAAMGAYIKTHGVMGTLFNGFKASARGIGRVLLTSVTSPLRLVGQTLLFVGRAALLNPIGLLVTAIGLGALAVYKYWQPIKAFFVGFWQGLQEGLAPVAEALGPAFTALGSALMPLKPIWDGISSALGTVWKWVTDLLTPINSTAAELDNATGAGKRFGLWLADLINIIPRLAGDFIGFGANLMEGFSKGIMSMGHLIKEALGSTISEGVDYFKSLLGIASPSKVFAVMGDQTMDGLTVGLNRSQQGPLNEVNKLSKQIAGTAFVLGISALPAAAMPNDVANLPSPAPIIQNREIIEQLSPAKMSQPEDAVRQVRDEHSVAALSAVPSVNREIIEQLSPAKLSQPEDAVRQVRDEHSAAVLPAVPAMNREIVEQIEPPESSAMGYEVLLLAVDALIPSLTDLMPSLAQVRRAFTHLRTMMSTASGTLMRVGQTLLFVGRAAALNPIGLLVTAIGLGALAVYKYWQPVKAFFVGFWQGLQEGLAPVAEALGPAFTAMGSALMPLKPIWDGIASVLGTVWKWVTDLLTPINATATELDNATGAGTRFGLWLADLVTLIPNVIGNFVGFGASIMSGISDGIMSRVSVVKESLGGAINGSIDYMKDLLGIASPSKVFAVMGDQTMQGLTVGISRTQQEPLAEVNKLSKQLAGTAFVLGISALPAAAMPNLQAIPDQTRTIRDEYQGADYSVPDAIRLVKEGELPARKPKSDNLSSDDNGLTHSAAPDRLGAFAQRQAPQPQAVHIDAGIHAPITIHATANMDAQDVARLVAIELEKRDRAQQARLRSSLKDLN